MSRLTIRVQVPKQDESIKDHLKQRILLNSPDNFTVEYENAAFF